MSGEVHDVEMPDGTIIEDVPVGTTQEELLAKYSKHKAVNTTFDDVLAQVKQNVGEALGPQKREAAMIPVRAALAAAKPFAGAAEWLGTDKPSKVINMMDELAKERSGAPSSVASFGGDIYGAVGGLNALKQGITKIPGNEALVNTIKDLHYSAVKDLPDIVRGLNALKQGVTKIPGSATLVNKVKDLPSIAKTALEAEVLGLASPTGETYGGDNFAEKKLHEAWSAPLVGAGMHSLFSGAASVLDPQLKRLAELKAQGVDVSRYIKNSTFGQVLGGVAQKVERGLESVPFGNVSNLVKAGADDFSKQLGKLERGLDAQTARKSLDLRNQYRQDVAGLGGDSGSKARQSLNNALEEAKAARKKAHDEEMKALEKEHGNFSVPIVNKVLEHIDESLPPGLTGHKAIEHAQKLISGDKLTGEKGAYDKVLENIGHIPENPQVMSNLDDILAKAEDPMSGLDENSRKELTNIVQNGLLKPLEETGVITPEKWHTIYKQLGNLAYSKGNGDAYQQSLGQVLRQVQNEWGALAENADGTGMIKKINQAYSALQPVQRAAAGTEASTRYGEFNPKELISSANAEASTRAAGAGNAPFQQEGIDAFNAMKAEKAAVEAKHAKELADLDAQHAQSKLDLENQLEQSGIQTDLAKTELKGKLDDTLLENRSNLAEKKAQLQEDNKDVATGVPSKFMDKLGWMATLGSMAPYIKPVAQNILSSEGNPIVAGAKAIMNEGFLPAAGVLSPMVGTRLLYGNETAQNALKWAATAERPEIMKEAGRKAREALEEGSLAPTIAGNAVFPPAPIYSGNNVQIEAAPSQEEPTQEGGIPVPKKAGGLVALSKRKKKK